MFSHYSKSNSLSLGKKYKYDEFLSKNMKKEMLISFLLLELLGVGMVYLGFKTKDGISVSLGIAGLLLVVITAWYFSEKKSIW